MTTCEVKLNPRIDSPYLKYLLEVQNLPVGTAREIIYLNEQFEQAMADPDK